MLCCHASWEVEGDAPAPIPQLTPEVEPPHGETGSTQGQVSSCALGGGGGREFKELAQVTFRWLRGTVEVLFIFKG